MHDIILIEWRLQQSCDEHFGRAYTMPSGEYPWELNHSDEHYLYRTQVVRGQDRGAHTIYTIPTTS